MGVAGNLIGERIDDRDERLLQVIQGVDDPRGHHQGGGRQHGGALGDDAAALLADILDSRVHTTPIVRYPGTLPPPTSRRAARSSIGDMSRPSQLSGRGGAADRAVRPCRRPRSPYPETASPENPGT